MELLNHLKAGRSQGSHPEQLGTGSPELDSHWIPAVIIIMICNKIMQSVYNAECMLQTDQHLFKDNNCHEGKWSKL